MKGTTTSPPSISIEISALEALGRAGLQYAFLAAGARSALVTLWRVPDQSAADFVQAFYRELKRGVAPREALQRVRAQWAGALDERAHPFRWGAFVLVGA